VRSIDPAAKRVETDAGSFQGDVVVVGLGADLDIAATCRRTGRRPWSSRRG
jgi:sulfide:quinone oxidoreductase